ncbi:MAG: outer membrane protein assembly factor BamD [Candidatus Marinimicrobia bacterium]|nr:outer membrane protein assembly factor BamD [Candidatus Neomarinimicrobiota bacterium]
MARSAVLCVIIGIMGCADNRTADELWQAADEAIAARKYAAAIKLLGKVVERYPDDPLAPLAQFKVGDVYMNKTNEVERSVSAYNSTYELYPETEEAAKALFMVGFVNANYIADLESAGSAYKLFLEQYPNHELVGSVQFELQNLGKKVEEIEALKGVVDAE